MGKRAVWEGCCASDLEAYAPMIRKVACCAMRGQRGSIDNLGLGLDDYEAELRVRAWQSLAEWRRDTCRRSRSINEERKFVYRSVWNRARDICVKRSRKFRSAPTRSFEEYHAPSDLSFESRAEARQSLRGIRSLLDDLDWHALSKFAVSEGGGMSGSDWGLRRRVRQIRKRVVSCTEMAPTAL